MPSSTLRRSGGQQKRCRLERRIGQRWKRLSSLRTARDEDAAFDPAAIPSVDAWLADRIGLKAEIERLTGARGRGHFETRTGFSVHGHRPVAAVANGWLADTNSRSTEPRSLARPAPSGRSWDASIVLTLQSKKGTISGTAFPVLPDFIGTIIADEAGRVTSVNYVPSDNSPRYAAYEARARQIERMKRLAAVSARHGRFVVDDARASVVADRIRQDKGLDPTLGIYAAYAYAQVGAYDDVCSVFDYMREDELQLPLPFDVAMLATPRPWERAAAEEGVRLRALRPDVVAGLGVARARRPNV